MTRRPPRRHRAPRTRRAVSQAGGPLETQGDPTACTLLATILSEDVDLDTPGTHMHGFHAYPARMHPTLGRRCIELMTPRSGSVLDPFCGSGTVLVEARIAGRAAWGADLNPLAVSLARLKTHAATECELDAFQSAARRVARHADRRRRERKGATRRFPQQDVRLFDPHVLLELDSLRDGLREVREEFSQRALRLVLSSILIKVSRQAGDTGGKKTEPKRLASGFTVDLFGRKASELAARMASFQALLPDPPPSVHVLEGDARSLEGLSDASVDLVVTSPPYAGTYDYLDHHRARLRWLDLPEQHMAAREIGARRHLERAGFDQALRRFSDDLRDVFQALRRVLRKDARAVVVVADSVLGTRPVWADPLIRRCAERAGLRWLATGSQQRPGFHGSSRAFSQNPRREHTIVLVR